MKNSKPKVSVVTITYAHEKYIEDTLRGVLMQQYDGSIEFIIANDNSPDSTDEVIRNYFNEHHTPDNFEIKYTKHSENKGMMPNFVWALEQATGEYIALCEGDDYWTDPLKLQKQVDFLEDNEEYNICFHKIKQINETGNSVFEFDLNNKSSFTLSDLCLSNFISTPSVVFRNLKSYPNFLYQAYPGDYCLHILNGIHGKFHFIDDEMGIYRIHYGGIHSTGVSDINKRAFRNTLKELESYLFKMNKISESKILRKRYHEALAINVGLKNEDNISTKERLFIIMKYLPIKSQIKIFFDVVMGKIKWNH